MSTTDTGVATDTTDFGTGSDDGFNAFLSHLLPDADKRKEEADASEEKPSEKTDTNSETDEETTEETSDESPDETDEETSEETDEQPAKKFVDTDDVFVKVKVGDQEVEASVKDLKRLYGQEAALTRRSQEVATERKKIEAEAQRYAAGLDHMMKAATSRADEFRNINFLALTKDERFSAEQLTALQDEARKAFEQEAFFKNEVNKVVEHTQQQMQTQLAETAKQTVKTLSDQASPLYIEGFNQDTYRGLITFAKEVGLDPELANNLVDASALKLIHMAMMYQNGAKKIIVTKKTNKTPKKIVKTSSSPANVTKDGSGKKAEAIKRLKKSGSAEDAEAAFLASLGASDDKE